MRNGNGRIALVTGASRGIGRAIALGLAERGFDLALNDIAARAQALAETAEAARARGSLVEELLADVSDKAAVQAMVAQAVARLGTIHAVVNNAGILRASDVEHCPEEYWDSVMDVNAKGTFLVTQAVLPLMRARRAGHILTVSSVGGLVPLPGLGIYNGSKFALEGMFAALAREVAQFGVKVTLVEPGMLRTGWDGRSMLRGEQRLADYAAPFAAIRQARLARHGKQPGDPHKAALAILAAVDAPLAPAHLLLGRDALAYAQFRNDELAREFRLWSALSKSVHVE